MNFPKEFSAEAQARVMQAKIEAAEVLVSGKGELPTTIGDGHREKGISRLLRSYILSVLGSFAHEACQLGLAGVWRVGAIDREVAKFIKDFVLETIQEHQSPSFSIPPLLSASGGYILPELWDGFRNSTEWRKYQRELLKVAKIQARPSDSSDRQLATAPPEFSETGMALSPAPREKRLRKFREPRTDLLKDPTVTLNRLQAAEALGVTTRTLDRYVTDKRLTPVGGFARRRFKAKDLLAFVSRKNRDNRDK